MSGPVEFRPNDYEGKPRSAAKGRKRGHPKKIDISTVLQMRGAGMTKAHIARIIGVHPTNIKRALDGHAKAKDLT